MKGSVAGRTVAEERVQFSVNSERRNESSERCHGLNYATLAVDLLAVLLVLHWWSKMKGRVRFSGLTQSNLM